MSRFWMVRAGHGGSLIEDFEQKNCVAVGWGDVGRVEESTTVDDLKQFLRERTPESHPSKVANVAAMIWKFAREMEPGDKVVTYDSAKREYVLGEIAGATAMRRRRSRASSKCGRSAGLGVRAETACPRERRTPSVAC